jgi:glycosyltransferase involved in cell wall biosynthesis
METALLVPPRDARKAADALLSILNDAALAQKLGTNARQRVLTHYDWKKNLDHIEQLYAEVLSK